MFKRLLTLVLVLLFIVGSSLAFDKSPGQLKEFAGWTKGGEFTPVLSDGWVDVTIIGHAEGLYWDYDLKTNVSFVRRAVGLFAQSGSGFHLGGGYIVTNAHVVKPSRVEIQLTSSFYYITAIDRVIDIDYMIGSEVLGKNQAYLVWVNEEQDLALLWVDLKVTPYLKDYGYRTTWTWTEEGSLIQEGDVIAAVVKARDTDGSKLWHYEIRYGKVTAPKPILPPDISSDSLPWFSLYDFTIDIVLYPGDSGSPIFAFDNGKPVIIGLGRAAWSGVTSDNKQYSWATRIDIVHKKMLER